jgi:hypothetical protein
MLLLQLLVWPGLILLLTLNPFFRKAGFLCTFTLSRPGLVGLNKLAIYLNDLQDSRSIAGWKANGWEDASTKERALIRFVSRADAIIATKGVR